MADVLFGEDVSEDSDWADDEPTPKPSSTGGGGGGGGGDALAQSCLLYTSDAADE